jgi:Pectate lyase superfamily protein
MNYKGALSRRHWLRDSTITAGVAGLVAARRSAIAAQAADENDPGVFNVMAFGAKGDGIADDTDAIQKAIDTAGNYSRGQASNGGIVYLPAGVYQVSRTLHISQAVKILGHGQATIDGATHIVPANLGFDVFKILGVNWGVVLEGFHIKAYNYAGSGGHFLRIEACQRVCVRDVHLINCWNGALVDSSGDVGFHDLNISGADVPGEGRFGLKCTAVSKGNPNSTNAFNCCVSQWGKNVRTMDGFVLANGYNSLGLINCGALNCNRAFWSTKDGGEPPNFFVISGIGTSDHCNQGILLEEGGFTQISGVMITSSYVDNITVGKEITGPVAFADCVVSTSGGAGYQIKCARSPNVSIVGGSVHDTSGNAMEISGNASALVTGVGIADVQSGKNADGVVVSGGGRITLTGLSITGVKHIAMRVMPDFTGTLSFSGITQQKAARGLFDEGSSGVLIGEGVFRVNSKMDVDVSKNQSPETCVRSYSSIPFPFYPSPPVPRSGVPVCNTTGTNCMIYLSGKSIKAVAVDGINLQAQTSVYVPAGRSIIVNYSGALTWIWQRVT